MSQNDSRTTDNPQTTDNPLKSLILCAGLGSRLRPMTDHIPKPLATVCNVAIFDAAIRQCVAAGSRDFAINIHHLPDVMAQYALQNFQRLGAASLHISREIPEILGTGGALVAIKQWWGQSPLLVYNGDLLSDLPLGELVTWHHTHRPLVTLAIRSTPPRDGGKSIWVNAAGEVVAIAKPSELPKDIDLRDVRETGYACAFVASPEFQAYLPQTPSFFSVIETFNLILQSGNKILTRCYDGFWADIGTPRSLWETNLKVAALSTEEQSRLLGAPYERRSDLNHCKSEGHSVIDPQALLPARGIISRSVILGPENISNRKNVENSLVGFGFDFQF